MIDRYDLVVVGAGPGGYVAAIRAAQLGMKVAVIEKNPNPGGTCLNVGCIPSKALLQVTEHYHWFHEKGKAAGVTAKGLSFELKTMMKRKEEIVAGFGQGIKGLFRKNKIKLFTGTAKLAADHIVEVHAEDEEMLPILADHVILASGSQPVELPFLPFDEERVISSTGALSLKKVPKHLLVVGGGVIGLELASVYRRLGAEVTVVELMDSICAGMDEEICSGMLKILQKEGFQFHLSTKVIDAKVKKSGVDLTVEKDGETQTLSGDVCLVAVGRKPYFEGLNLEAMGVQLDETGRVIVDNNFRTTLDDVYAIGDIISGPMLAHKASEEGVAVAELLVGMRPHVNYLAIPNVIYTHPEAASVGISRKEAKELGMAIKTGTFPFKANSRARCIGDDEGFVKVVQEVSTGRLVGMHILGPCAGELIHEGVVAIEQKATVREMAYAPHAHPTLAEAVKEACLSVDGNAIHI